MVKLTKKIGYHECIVYGPNATLLKWAQESQLAEFILKSSKIDTETLYIALGSQAPQQQIITAKDTICKLWYSYPELGPYPFIETLSEFEFNRIFYPDYRDHVIHQLKVWLMGLYLFDQCNLIKDEILGEIRTETDNDETEEFLRRWLVCAIYHDIGYVLENEHAEKSTGDAWKKTSDVINEVFSSLLSYLPSIKLTKEYEHKVIQDHQIFCKKIKSPKEIEQYGNLKLFSLLSEFGVKAGLGYSDSPLFSYYAFASKIGPDNQKRPTFKDHGIVSALLLFQIWFSFRDYMEKISCCTDHPILNDKTDHIKIITQNLKDCQRSIISAAGAISLHNIYPGLWETYNDSVAYSLTLDKFCIRLTDNNIKEPLNKTPLAFLLGLSDLLQDWDRLCIVLQLQMILHASQIRICHFLLTKYICISTRTINTVILKKYRKANIRMLTRILWNILNLR